MKLISFILITIISTKAWGDCPEFATALEAAMSKVLSRETKSASAKPVTVKLVDPNEEAAYAKWGSLNSNNYKVKYAGESTDEIMKRSMETDKKLNPNDS